MFDVEIDLCVVASLEAKLHKIYKKKKITFATGSCMIWKAVHSGQDSWTLILEIKECLPFNESTG